MSVLRDRYDMFGSAALPTSSSLATPRANSKAGLAPSSLTPGLGTPRADMLAGSLGSASGPPHSGLSPVDRSLAAAAASRPLSSMPGPLGAASVAAPATPSNWMVRDPSSLDRTPLLTPLPGATHSLPSGTSLYSSSAAPAGTQGVSPLLKPRHAAVASFSDTALQDAVELHRAETQTAVERSTTSRRFTSRSASSSSLQTPALTAGTPRSVHADGDSPSTSVTVQRLSRRASASRSLDGTRAEEDTVDSASFTRVPSGLATAMGNVGSFVLLSPPVRRGRSTNSAVTTAEEDVVSAGTPLLADGEPDTPAGLATSSQGQASLHVSRTSSGRTSAARTSSTATTAPCLCVASLVTPASATAGGSLSAMSILTAAVPRASRSTHGHTEAVLPHPDRLFTANLSQPQQDSPTTSAHTSAAPPPPPPPSPSQHHATTLMDEGRAGSSGAVHTSFGSGKQQQQQSSPAQASPDTPPTQQQQQLAAHLCGSGTADGAASSSAFVTMNHFASVVELQHRPRYLKVSSCASFGVGAAADEEGDDSGELATRRTPSATTTTAVAEAAAAAAVAAAASNATWTSSIASAPWPSWGAGKSSFATSTSTPSFPLASASYGSMPSSPGMTAATTAAMAGHHHLPTTDTWMIGAPDLHFGAAGSPPPPPTPAHLGDAGHSTVVVNADAGGRTGDSPLVVGGTARPLRSRVRGVSQPVEASKLLFSRGHVPSFSTTVPVKQRSRSSEDVCAGAADGDSGAVDSTTTMGAATQGSGHATGGAPQQHFPPPPPPPPPPSRIPSPMLRSLGHMSGGFAAFSHDQYPQHHHHHHQQQPHSSGHHDSLHATHGTVYDVTGRLVMYRTASGSASPLPESVPQQQQQREQQHPPQLPAPSSLPPSRLMSESVVGDEDRGVSFGHSTAFSSKPGSFSSAATTVATAPRHSTDDRASRATSPSLMPSTSLELSQAHSTASSHPQQQGCAARGRSADVVRPHHSPLPACKVCGATLDTSGGGGEVGLVEAIVTRRQLSGGGSSSGGKGVGGCRRCSSASFCEGCCECRHSAPSLNGHLCTAPVVSTPVRASTPASVASSMLSLAATMTSVLTDPLLRSFSSSTNLTAPQSATVSNLSGQGLNASGAGVGTATGDGPSPPRSAEIFVMRSDAETVQGLPRGKVPRMPGCSMRDWAAHLSLKEAEVRRREQQQQHRRAPAPMPRFGNAAGGGAASGATAHGGCGAGARFASLPRMTPQEVAHHNTSDDLWIVIRNVVYDCTTFQRFHPGGEKLLLACAGRDATAVYDRFHAWVSCESFMAPYAVGVLAAPDSR